MVQVREVHQELRNKGTEVEEMVAAAEVKDADNTRLWDQVHQHFPLTVLPAITKQEWDQISNPSRP